MPTVWVYACGVTRHWSGSTTSTPYPCRHPPAVTPLPSPHCRSQSTATRHHVALRHPRRHTHVGVVHSTVTAQSQHTHVGVVLGLVDGRDLGGRHREDDRHPGHLSTSCQNQAQVRRRQSAVASDAPEKIPKNIPHSTGLVLKKGTLHHACGAGWRWRCG